MIFDDYLLDDLDDELKEDEIQTFAREHYNTEK